MHIHESFEESSHSLVTLSFSSIFFFIINLTERTIGFMTKSVFVSKHFFRAEELLQK